MKIAIPISKSKSQYFINTAYMEYIKESGYSPILITPHCDVEFMVSICDGLILPGGIDLDSTYYGENNAACFKADLEKDAFERHLFYSFAAFNKPIFGICRGFQLIAREYMKEVGKHNKYLTYYQHINDHSIASDLDLSRSNPSHDIKFLESALYGRGDNIKLIRGFVNSMHHQALIAYPPDKSSIRKLDGFSVIAYTEHGIKERSGKNRKYIVEAFQITDWCSEKIMAVQWHPEEMMDTLLLKNFFG